MENSIQDLISALQHNISRSVPQNQPSSSAFPPPIVTREIQQDGGETDEDSDNITRPTAAGTDDSEERIIPLQVVLTIDSPAPVEIIRELASEFLDHQSPKTRNKYIIVGAGDDIIAKGLLTESQAQELLDMYSASRTFLTIASSKSTENGSAFRPCQHYSIISVNIHRYC